MNGEKKSCAQGGRSGLEASVRGMRPSSEPTTGPGPLLRRMLQRGTAAVAGPAPSSYVCACRVFFHVYVPHFAHNSHPICGALRECRAQVPRRPARARRVPEPSHGVHAQPSWPQPAQASLGYGGGEVCARCRDVVYFAERQVGTAGRVYHVRCFRCRACEQRLASGSYRSDGGELYCEPCHRRHLGPRGYGYGLGSALRCFPGRL
ncbi:hypothetical protein HPB49_010242 [Dermacentor silvarum]|uniref:Uncharacterized protein n=1 Tax=Dermacentor silvarum TaxID=543639 RepID=A0ACB8D4H3_DERSI|nr:hypothetical protein HPB49_010242 [Dermacentor silvarum]